MLGAPPLSRTPTDVSQRSFGGVLQRGVGTPRTASSVRSYTIAMNRSPSVHDMQGKAYGIRDVAPWVDCDFEIPGKPFGGGGSGIRDVAPWVDYEVDRLVPGSRSPILPVSLEDMRQDAVLFSGSGSPTSKSKTQNSPSKSLGSLGTETGSSPLTSEQREVQMEMRKARQRRREVDREKREKERERRRQPRSSRNNLARSLNPLAKLFDCAADTNPQAKYTVNPDLDRNPHPPLTPARPQVSPPRTPPRPASAFGNLPTAAGVGTSVFPYGFTPLRTPVDPLTDTQWMQFLRLNQHIRRLPQNPVRPLPLPLMPDPYFPTPAEGPPASGSAPKLLAPPNTPVARCGLGSVAATAAGEGGAGCRAAGPASARRASPQATKAAVGVRVMEALVAFQRGGGVDDEGFGFRDPSETGDGTGEKVEVLALEGEVEECSDEEMRWRGWGEHRFECFHAILGEGDWEVVDDY